MTHIDEVEDILEGITGYSIIQSKIDVAFENIYIMPSDFFDTEHLEKLEFFDIMVIESTLEKLQTKKDVLLNAKTTLGFDFNDFDARSYITTSDGADFSISDAIVGTTSGATGTVYKIGKIGAPDEDVVYLKDTVGVWQSEAINGKTATCLGVQTVIIFPFYIDNELMSYNYPLDFSSLVGGDFNCWIRIEARWTL
jgi:hypothetical protein